MLALVGCGYWGKNLLRVMDSLGVLYGFFDHDQSTAVQVSKQYPRSRKFESFAEILESDGVKGVVIAAPAVDHGSLARKCIEARKSAFVEKPLCLDPSEAQMLVELADKNEVKLMVGHLLLYHPAFRKLKTMISEGVLGSIRQVYSNRLSLGKIRREENSLWSFAPHDISMILSLMNDVLPEHVSCFGQSFLTSQVEDTTLSVLNFANGAFCHIFVSWLHPFKVQELVVIGDRAMASFSDSKPTSEKLLLYPHQAAIEQGVPIIQKATPIRVDYDDEEPLKLELVAFLEYLRADVKPPSIGNEGLRVLKVLSACQRALESRQTIRLEDVYVR